MRAFFLISVAIWSWLAAGCSSPQVNGVKAIVGATLIDGQGGAPIPESIVLIEKGIVKAAGSRANVGIPAGAEKIDGTGKFLVPGLIDLHVHLGAKAGPQFVATDYTRDRVARSLNAYLYYGVTSVRSVGTEREAGFEIRQAQRSGSVAGARLFTAGRGFTCTNGHPSQEVGGIARQVDHPDQAREQVRELAAQQVDLIKMWVDDRLGQSPKIRPEVSAAISDEARRHNIPVVAHIRTLADTQHLLAAGVSGFLHMIRDTEDLPRPLIDQVLAKNIVFTPTLIRQELAWLYREHPDRLRDADLERTLEAGVIEAVRADTQNREATPVARKEFDIAMRNTRRMAAAGVAIGVGSDGGSSNDFPGAMTHREIELLVQAGFSPSEAVVAATRNGALALGKANEFGTIEAGKRADLLLLSADPLANVANLRRIERLMFDGEWVDRSRLTVR